MFIGLSWDKTIYLEYMQKHPDRIKVLHIKDRAVFGQSGMMNFEMIFKQMYANGIEKLFVELEPKPRYSSPTQYLRYCGGK